jgi:hypothetical protein
MVNDSSYQTGRATRSRSPGSASSASTVSSANVALDCQVLTFDWHLLDRILLGDGREAWNGLWLGLGHLKQGYDDDPGEGRETNELSLQRCQLRLDGIFVVKGESIRKHVTNFLAGLSDNRGQHMLIMTHLLICSSLGGLVEKAFHILDAHLPVNLLEHIIALLEAVEH